MKNLLIYVHPLKTWMDGWGEQPALARLQIDNSLDLGWKREDILIMTNFPFQYNGVKATVLAGDHYCEVRETASKINVICHMFDAGLIGDDMYWFHDFDAYQLEDLETVELDNQIGVTDYGITQVGPKVDKRWSTGVIFFKKDCADVFRWIQKAVYKYKNNEEVALQAMTRKNKHGLLNRIKKLNITYNMATRKRRIRDTYEIAEKPLKVIHFHPKDDRRQEYGMNNVDICIHGYNKLNKVLVPNRLISLFKEHGLLCSTV
jgi:hypothetical protein